MATFVIPAKEEEGIGIPDLQTPKVEHTLQDHQYPLQERDGHWRTHLDTEVSPIDIITQKEISRGRRAATDLEQFHKIIL